MTCFCLQEDEVETARRKMKQEEEEVDVEGIFEVANEQNPQVVGLSREDDEDILWADKEPDDDVRNWNMKIIIEGLSNSQLHICYIQLVDMPSAE